MSTINIGIFIGSLRKASYSKGIARYIEKQSSENIRYQTIEIGDLALYNQDLDDENSTLSEYTRFRNEVKSLDGFIFITPEYNRSIPAVLKNALDVGSRPYGQSVWYGKPGAVISLSPGNLGGFGANHHLRQILVCLNVLTLQQPEAYLTNIANNIDSDGNMIDPKFEEFFSNFLKAVESWVIKMR